MMARAPVFPALRNGLFLVVALALAIWAASGAGEVSGAGAGDDVVAIVCCDAHSDRHRIDKPSHSEAPVSDHHQGGKDRCGTVASHCSVPALGLGTAGIPYSSRWDAKVAPGADDEVLTCFLDVEIPPPRA